MAEKVFLPGVPATPEMWRPLLAALSLELSPHLAPALPGFGEPRPAGFKPTKESYVDWFIEHLERQVDQNGPVYLVAHDWGAMIALRTVSIRPDLVRTWTAINAAPHEQDLWHGTAKIWQTPIIGELSMLATRKAKLATGLQRLGMPHGIAQHEAQAFNWHMRSSILGLYRSAMKIGTEWYPDFQNFPPNGLIIWGESDPYGPIEHGEGFANRFDLSFIRVRDAGQWPFLEHTDKIARALEHHWASPASE